MIVKYNAKFLSVNYKVGAYRCVGCKLNPQFGSGPFKESSQNGYLSTAEYEELLRYAYEHNIHVITEINGPGI